MSRRHRSKFVGYNICAEALPDRPSALPPASKVVCVVHSKNEAEARSAHQFFGGADDYELPSNIFDPANYEPKGLGSDFGGLGSGYDAGKIPSNIAKMADDLGSIKDGIDITNEDLKYLRDLAEQETINRFTTAEIHVEMGGVNNTVNSNMDLDGVVDYMVTGVQEAMERVAEGVHN
jgi:hypothetical protein